MGKGNSADKGNASQRFMRAMGKLRVILGPANRSSLVHDMTEENRALLAQRERETQQWETVHPPGRQHLCCAQEPGRPVPALSLHGPPSRPNLRGAFLGLRA